MIHRHLLEALDRLISNLLWGRPSNIWWKRFITDWWLSSVSTSDWKSDKGATRECKPVKVVTMVQVWGLAIQREYESDIRCRNQWLCRLARQCWVFLITSETGNIIMDSANIWGSLHQVVEWFYGYMENMAVTIAVFGTKGILVTLNDLVGRINYSVCTLLPGIIHGQKRSDSIMWEGDSDMNVAAIQTKDLKSVIVSGLPSHNRKLENGGIVFLVSTLHNVCGLFNGTLLIVDGVVWNRLLRVRVARGRQKGNIFLLTRTTLILQYG